MGLASESINRQVEAHAADIPGCGEIAEQMCRNLVGANMISRGERVRGIGAFPIGRVETSDTVRVGHGVLNRQRISSAIIAFSVNSVGDGGEADLDRAARVVRTVSETTHTPTTFFTETYPEEKGKIGHIRKRLVAAATLAPVMRGWVAAGETSLLMGDIDLVDMTQGTWQALHDTLSQFGTAFSQAPVRLAYSRDLQAAGLLPRSKSFPQMDRVAYWYNQAIRYNGFVRQGQWNAMRLSGYLSVGGYDSDVAFHEDFDLQDRFFARVGAVRMPTQLKHHRVLENPRRLYVRLRNRQNLINHREGAGSFQTVGDTCRGVPLEALQDISREDADEAIESLWELKGYYGPGRTLGDAICWYRAQQRLGRADRLEWRAPPEDWLPSSLEVVQLDLAKDYVESLRATLVFEEPGFGH